MLILLRIKCSVVSTTLLLSMHRMDACFCGLLYTVLCFLSLLLLLLFLPTGTSFPGDRKLAKCRSVSGMVTTGTQKQSTSWSDIKH